VVSLWIAGLICGGALLPASPGRAQVLEIGDGGEVRTFDGPAVFTRDGAAPIARTHARPRWRANPTPATDSDTPSKDHGVIAEAARAAELSPALVEAVAWRESRFRQGVVSPAGAIGEMQLMPATARALGVDPRDTRQNYGGGAAFLGLLVRRYDGDLMRALAAYNAGPGAVDRYGGVPPFKETQAYVAAIMDRLSRPVYSSDSGASKN
jgi:soluble lytic murein transglycosylase-like protein